MTTVRFLSRPTLCRAIRMGVVGLVLVLLFGSNLSAQQPPKHWLHSGVMPPGAIGAQQKLRSGPLSLQHLRPAYIQPVEILVGDQPTPTTLEPVIPEVSVVSGGGWTTPASGRMLVGLEVGRPYRFRVRGVKLFEEVDIYPTIELVDRLYPPPGKATKFPVPVELTTNELRVAAQGGFVTRVIYVEDPGKAVPIPQHLGQPFIDALAGDDPLVTAGQLGRPIAILRIGSRGPGSNGLNQRFTFGNPPVQLYGARPVEQ